MKHLPAGLYGIVTEKLCKGRSVIEVAEAMIAGGVRIIQYREKEDKPKNIQYQECLTLRKMTKEAGVLFLINDFIDLALACEADGVHIGQEDLPPAVVRKLVGPSKIIGLSTHSPEQAQRAQQEGIVDYIGVGPLFPTQTKVHPEGPVGLAYLDYVTKHITLPFVAIGGIKEHNLEEVLKHSAKTVCLVTEITEADNIFEKLRALNEILRKYGIP
ncbi:thiamine phosphate synthase [Thermospira aquatica]|uniref:Thiamine-phosphate synthase n=1 Tax=Thermospira aquatica TaxID=2828656 RepID=A0AAX3BAY6_9SPIR|nr:thiamine phosphate synthase [Thermospira aquatica]URA09472.1 thiamine phosphate synthase [Thermospira aquatica]